EGIEAPAAVREADALEESAPEKAAVSSYGSGVKMLRPIPAVNPLLDWNVPFQDRFALVMKEKERRMERGELFHAMFDDVITAVMENVNPYLIGPSGCGKTFMVKQVGELLGLDCTDIGYINEEYDILGYVTAGGTYNESNFYRLYKYGGIVFCDELDNGNSKATVKLNSFLTNQKNSYYHFPGGERVERHPNFRVIAAGNTDGSGADTNYSTREKIEESVLQRMIPIYMDYDNRVEEQILKDYPDWFEFGCAFRKATDEWEKACGIPAQGIFTTRDAYRIRQYLENSSFSNEKIMNYEFVQTKEAEYLGFLQEKLSGFISESSGAYALYRLFVKLAEAIREKGKRV
ncbi:MAG: AAA family ATPase, partial [Lachnospiraceae bacterium]|nr:AAA family ATPase [Lachnospiraceae bacterium]